jgi:hypothetical protein
MGILQRKGPDMNKLFTRKRLSTLFCGLGVSLMGVDLLMTRNFFVHIGELMVASIFCLTIGLVLDRVPDKHQEKARSPEKRAHKKGLRREQTASKM